MPRRDSAEADAALLHAIGERLRLSRARRGMTRRVLAQHSGVSERYIAQMEAGGGNVSVLVLRALAEALGATPAELLSEIVEPAIVGAESRQQRIALIGLRGAGKSALGRRLADSQGVTFQELDRQIEREAGMELAEVFALHGQTGFRRLERAALEHLLADTAAMVIAAGGSIVTEPATYARLRSACRTVWVRATPEEHMQRVIDQGDLRPMRNNRRAMEDLRGILASREALYAKADLVLDTSGRSVAESFSELMSLLGEGNE